MITVADALARLRAAEASGALARTCAQQGVDVLVHFGSSVAGDHPGDIDLAVGFIPGRPGDLLATIDALAELVPGDHLDVMDLDRAGPVAMHRAMTGGRLLYESGPSRFAERQIFAINHYIDTEPFRRLLAESLLQ